MATETLPIEFDYAAFIVGFPEFTTVPETVADFAFATAALFFVNDSTNPAALSGNMAMLLNLATAHVLKLRGYPVAGGGTGPQPTPAPVGRMNSASEGSVSIGVDWKGDGPPSMEWWLQTQYGAMFWQATVQYRTMRYYANPVNVWGGLYPGVSTYRGR
jgi:hypothetical protein